MFRGGEGVRGEEGALSAPAMMMVPLFSFFIERWNDDVGLCSCAT